MQPNTPTNRYIETLHVSHHKNKINMICGLMCAAPVFNSMRSFLFLFQFFFFSINFVIFLFVFLSIRFEFLINILVTAMVSHFNRKWCNIASQIQQPKNNETFLARTFLFVIIFFSLSTYRKIEMLSNDENGKQCVQALSCDNGWFLSVTWYLNVNF